MNSSIQDAPIKDPSIQDPSIKAPPARGLRARLRGMMAVDDSAVLWLRLWRGLAVLVLLFGFGSLARANCGVSMGTLAMGQYDPIGTHAAASNDSGSTTVNVVCHMPPGTGNPNVAFTADLGPGANASGIQRRMRAGPGEYLDYGVYLDAGRSVPFGTQSGGVAVTCEAGSTRGYCTGGSGGARERSAYFTVFGRIPGGQAPSVGTYRDTLVLTIAY